MPYLWIFFIFLPLLEIITFLAVADAIGFFSALAGCILMAVLGVTLIQRQGLENFLRAQGQLRTGNMPLRDLFNGLCVVMAGFLFILPGFLSDIVGILLLIPNFREKMRGFLSPRMQTAPADPAIIDVAFERVDEPRERLRP